MAPKTSYVREKNTIIREKYGVVNGVVTPKNSRTWQMGKSRYEKSTLLRAFFVAPQVGLEPTTLRLTADIAFTMLIVIGNSHTK